MIFLIVVINIFLIIYYFIRKRRIEKEKKIIQNTKNDIESGNNDIDYEKKIIEDEKKVRVLGYCVGICTCISCFFIIILPIIFMVIVALFWTGD